MTHEREESIEAGLRAVFRGRKRDESVIEQLGIRQSVLLQDVTAEPSPIVRPTNATLADQRYQLLGEIAHGGVGIVYKSRDADLARNVALKVLREEFADNPDVIGRFIEEAQIGGQLQHPGIVPVYGLGLQPDGRPYFAMKLVKGRTLAALLQERSDTASERRRFLGLFEQICQTVAYAHARGVLHRDLKPSNVMVGAFGEVQVVDWGFAKVLGNESPRPQQASVHTVIATVRTGEGSSHSQAGSVMGTPAYMSPEQALGQVDELDERADVFSLGGILCEILTGAPPYAGEPGGLLMMAAQARLDPALARLDACDAAPELVALTKRCLAPERNGRPRHAGLVADAIGAELSAAEERARRAALEAATARAAREEARARRAAHEASAKAQLAHVEHEKRVAAKERARQKEQRRRAAWEKRAHGRAIASGAALLLAVLVGGGGLLVAQASEADRRARVEGAVAAELRTAAELESAQRFAEAAAAAQGAWELAQDTRPETIARAEAVRTRIRTKARTARESARLRAEEQALIEALDAAAATDPHDGGSAFARAFEGKGLDVDGDTVRAVARLQASGEPAAFAAYLDAWMWRRRAGGGDWHALGRAARDIDKDPERRRLRTAILAGDLRTLRRRAAGAGGGPPRTQHLLATALYENGDAAAAVRVLEAAATRTPDAWYLRHAAGAMLLEAEPPRPRRALAHLCAAVARRPRSKPVRLALARAHYRSGLGPQAVAICKELAAAAPKDPVVQRVLGFALLHAGNRRGAAEAFRRSLQLDARQFDPRFGLALCNRDPRHAVVIVKRALTENPPLRKQEELSARWALAAWLLDMGDRPAALAQCERMIALDANFAPAHAERGTVLDALGRVDEAGAAFAKALALGDDHEEVHRRVGRLHLRMGRWDEARTHLQRAVELDPHSGRSHAAFAHYHLARAEPDAAERYARDTIRVNPREALGWYLLASAERMRGRFEEADNHLRRAVGLAPMFRAPHAELFLRRGRYQDALSVLEQGGTLPRDAAFVAYVAGCCWLALEEPEHALPKFRTCRELGGDPRVPASALDRMVDRCDNALALKDRLDEAPADPDGALRRARALRVYGRHADATKLYEQVEEADHPEWAGQRVAAAASAVAAGRPRVALRWLRAELGASREACADADEGGLIAIRRALYGLRTRHAWARVRDPRPVERLDPDARTGWILFWHDLNETIRRTREAK